uniref:SSD domain-containing protein n=1 Tax=Angiostrongylus cantonensis TaxID=6313 RepID=A0A0K0DAN3_ANGCA
MYTPIVEMSVAFKVLSEHWPLDEQRFWPGKSYDLKGYIDVIVAGKEHPQYGRPNILSLKYLDEVSRINQYIINNVTVPVAYTDLCMTYDWACYLNDHLTMLMPRSRWGDFSGPIAEFASDIINNEVNITYPIGWRGSEPIYFGALVGEPHLVDNQGHFDYATALRLTYNVREQKVGNISFIWRKKLTAWLTDRENPPSGIWCPLLAVITSFGLLLWLGELYNAIVNVSPFLILCIGIDDLFIMSAEWHRTNPEHSPARRIADTLSEAAVAITITSITDIVSSTVLSWFSILKFLSHVKLSLKNLTTRIADHWRI